MLFVFLSASALLADDPPRFVEIAFPPGPRITDRVAVDLDDDGKKDLIVVRGRDVSIYLQRRGTFTPDQPSQRFRFVDKAILWDLGDVHGDGQQEILFLASDGIYYYQWEAGRISFVPHLLLKTDSILKTASHEEVRQKHFFQDLDGDGVPDLLLPGDGCFLWHRGLGHEKFAPAERLDVRPEVWIDGGADSPTSLAQSSYWYPQVVPGMWGKGRRALFVSQREQIAIFLARKDGGFGPSPTLALPLRFTGPQDEGRFQLDMQLPTKFGDVDGDGTTDAVATHIGRATTYVFRGGRDRKDLEKPDAIIKLSGLTFLNFLVDLDGDGRQDLVIARTDRPGVLDLVKILITREVPVEVLIYYGRSEDLPFPREPDERREVSIPILFGSARRGVNVGTSAVISLLGDFDGDGKNDLLLRKSDRSLAVYRSLGRGFTDDPAFEIQVSEMDGFRFIEPVTAEMNGDGVSDLILTYYSWDGKGDKLSVLLSTGKRPLPREK